jgi:hypothetical protein
MHATRRLIAPLVAAAALAAAAVPAAHAATSFQIGTGAHPDIAVDQSGTAHVVWDENSGQVGVADPLHYCQLPRGATACASERVLSPPLEAIGRSSYVFVPTAGRVLVETYRCCGPGEGNYLYESNDGGATFGPARQIGDIDHDSDAVFGPGETISGASVSSYQQMPLAGPAVKATADFNAGFLTLRRRSSLGERTTGQRVDRRSRVDSGRSRRRRRW